MEHWNDTQPSASSPLGEPMHVAMVGMPASGKTTVGRLLAEATNVEFVDLDEVIAEAAGQPLTALFASQGETIFRAHERRHLRALLRRERPMVLACGGGTWADHAMRRELLHHTRPILLTAPKEALLERLEASGERALRPLLAGPDPRAALERLWRAREPMHALCPRQVATEGRSAAEVAALARELLDAPADAERMARALEDMAARASAVAIPAGGQRRERAQAQGARALSEAPTPGLRPAAAPPMRPARPLVRPEAPAAAPAPSGRPAAATPAAPPPAAAPPAAERPIEVRPEAEPTPSARANAPTAEVAEPPAVAPAAESAGEAIEASFEGADGGAEEEPIRAFVDAPADNDRFRSFLAQDIEPFAGPLTALEAQAGGAAADGDQGASAHAPFLTIDSAQGAYPIYLLDGDDTAGAEVQAVAELIDAHSHGTRISLVADNQVAARHGAALGEALRARGLAVSLHTFAAGEESKRLATAHGLYDELADAGHGREDTLVALGGGVTTDLAGFVASTYMRGVPLVQVPTSTLAAVDSCIGGKTGLNTNRGKNLVGTFCAPRAVVVSPAYLRTQSQRAHLAGLVEAAKMAALLDAPLLSTMQREAKALAAGEPALVRQVIGRALVHKAEVVARDERERGERALLNYGHTLGHAIEVGEGFGRLHGEAVALGMLAEAEWAEAHGHASDVSNKLAEVLEALGVSTEWRAARVDLDALGRDKKRLGDTLELPVVTALGEARIVPVALDELIDFAQATMLPSVRWAR